MRQREAEYNKTASSHKTCVYILGHKGIRISRIGLDHWYKRVERVCRKKGAS